MPKTLNPRRYDRLDAALSFGLFLVMLFLLCLVIENEGRKLPVPPAPAPAGNMIPLDLGMN